MRFYLASSLENHAEVSILARYLTDAGHVHTYDWTKHGSVQGEGEKRIAEVAALELEGVRSADVVIVVMPGGRGTHVELGIAIGLGKWVILLSDFDHLLDHSGRTCAFYYAPRVEFVTSPSEVFKRMHAAGRV